MLWNNGSPLRRALFVPVPVAVGAVLAVSLRSALPAQPLHEKLRMQPAAGAAAEYLTQTPASTASAPSASAPTSASASPSHSPSPSATSSASSGGSGCTATYTVTGQWRGGFQVSVTVTAGSAPISAWTVRFAFANGQSVTQSWSAALSQSGPAVTADNLSWDGALAAGTSTSFGFLADTSDSADSTNSAPVVTCAAR